MVMENPWLNISAADYEAHMSSPKADQLAFLGRTFKEALEKHDCSKVALLGCATGNGLEYINSNETEKVTAMDINPEYLEIVRQRYEKTVPGLAIIEADLQICKPEKQAYSLIYAGLIFEYLSPHKVLPGIADGLHRNGVMVAVLQLHSKGQKQVTDTPYASLKKLESIMQLVSPQDFGAMANEAGLKELKGRNVTLNSGKPFYIGTYIKM
jgi:trans-aconitate methyltransferase